MDELIKKAIDDMPYEEMVKKWRLAPAGDLLFQGEIGEYFSKVMVEKRSRLNPGEDVSIS